MDKKAKKLINSLEKFEEAYNELNADWIDYEENIETPSYPFKTSFCDIPIPEWINDFKDNIIDHENNYQFEVKMIVSTQKNKELLEERIRLALSNSTNFFDNASIEELKIN